jgi:hypothetical protein
MAGWSAYTEGSGDNLKAIVEIYRRDWTHPLKHEVYFKECVQTKSDGRPSHFWSKMPAFMLKKVCISQAFRLAFPDELGGMPYTADELPEEMTGRDKELPKPKQVARQERDMYDCGLPGPLKEPRPRDVTPQETVGAPKMPPQEAKGTGVTTTLLDQCRDLWKQMKDSGLFNDDEMETYAGEMREAAENNTRAVIYGEMLADFNKRNILKAGKPAIQPEIF